MRLLDAEGPVAHEAAGMRDRGIGECLADDAERHAVLLAQRIGLEDRLLEIGGPDVLRQEFDRRELALDRVLHAVGAVSKFPVRGHEIDAEQLLRAEHVGALRPERARRALPAVAAVEQQRVGPRSSQPLHQRREVGEAAGGAVAARERLEIEMGERMRQAALPFDPEFF